MLIPIDGLRVGHWTDAVARTGCTVVLLPEGTVASGEVRGGAPATREFELLRPDRLVDRVDAVVLTGGSAFGLATADGVMRHCEEIGQGFATAAGPVPIVVAMGLFDLLVGEPTRPGSDEGYAAARAASEGPFDLGAVGAGVGCTINKWRGMERRRDGGLAGHVIVHGELIVAALVAVNAFGDLDDGSRLVDRLHEPGEAFDVRPVGDERPDDPAVYANTTIGVVVTNAALDKAGCFAVAQGAHDGLARAVAPTHTKVDGDAFVAAATGSVDVVVDEVRFLAVAAVEAAIRALGTT